MDRRFLHAFFIGIALLTSEQLLIGAAFLTSNKLLILMLPLVLWVCHYVLALHMLKESQDKRQNEDQQLIRSDLRVASR